MDFSILSMLQRRMAEAKATRQPLPSTRSELETRLSRTRESLLRCLGTRPPEILSPEVRTEAVIELSGTGVIQERIVYRSEVDVWIPAHVYRPATPAKERLPGVLLIQGWDLDKHSLPEFKVRLAQAGNVVLFPDNRFSGERRRAVGGQAEQSNLLPVAGLFGLTYMGMNTWDNQCALNVLANRAEVDADRMAAVGLCWGAMQAWVLAALDPRVKAACPVCGVSTFEALVREFIPWTDGHTCFGTYFWDWARHGDIEDIIACIAPRPLLIQNNVNDTWFPISGYHDVVKEVSRVYETFDAADRFEHHARITTHDITPEFGSRTIEFLARHLPARG